MRAGPIFKHSFVEGKRSVQKDRSVPCEKEGAAHQWRGKKGLNEGTTPTPEEEEKVAGYLPPKKKNLLGKGLVQPGTDHFC